MSMLIELLQPILNPTGGPGIQELGPAISQPTLMKQTFALHLVLLPAHVLPLEISAMTAPL